VILAKYRDAARTVAQLALGDMLPLDEAIPELASQPKKGLEKAVNQARVAEWQTHRI
jgi:hypothetical protein